MPRNRTLNSLYTSNVKGSRFWRHIYSPNMEVHSMHLRTSRSGTRTAELPAQGLAVPINTSSEAIKFQYFIIHSDEQCDTAVGWLDLDHLGEGWVIGAGFNYRRLCLSLWVLLTCSCWEPFGSSLQSLSAHSLTRLVSTACPRFCFGIECS